MVLNWYDADAMQQGVVVFCGWLEMDVKEVS